MILSRAMLDLARSRPSLGSDLERLAQDALALEIRCASAEARLDEFVQDARLDELLITRTPNVVDLRSWRVAR